MVVLLIFDVSNATSRIEYCLLGRRKLRVVDFELTVGVEMLLWTLFTTVCNTK
jgi:hypothetical protein